MHNSTLSLSASRRLLRSLAASLLLSLPVLPLFAQTVPVNPDAESEAQESADKAPADTDVVVLETMTVRAGFSGSLADAMEAKRISHLITDVITAEDIGKLPDISIAESLARLPGLTAQRMNSRAQAIVIRGLAPDFGTALLNGREQVSASGGRAVEFDQYPAELLSSVVVYKTGDASLVGQGLSGTVDLRTRRPLSQGARTFATNFFYEWTDMGALNAGSKDYGTRYMFSYIDQFKDRTVGIALGYSHSTRPGQGEQWNAWGFPDAFYNPALPRVLGGAKPFVRSSELKRDGWMGVIEYAPHDRFRSTIDLYYSDFKENQLLRGIEIPLQWSSAVLQPGYTASDGFITKGTFTNVFGVMRNDIVTRDAEVMAGGWNLEFGDKEDWLFGLDMSYSQIDRKDTILETYSGYASNQVGTPDTVTYTMGQGAGGALFATALDYTDGSLIRLRGPQGWGSGVVPGGQVGFIKGPFVGDELGQFKLTAERPMDGFFKRLEGGVAYTRRAKDTFEMGPEGMEGFYLALKNGATSAPLPPSVGITDLSFIGIKGMISYDPLAAFNSGIYDLIPNDNPALRSENWDVTERVTLGYVELDINHTIGSIPVKGNIGAQVISTEQEAGGLAVTGIIVTPVRGSHDYIDFVPSLNLTFDLGDGKMVRFSAARQLARQAMTDMRAGSTYGFDVTKALSTDPLNSPWSGGGGNPALEPWRSNSVDLSFEKYFKGGLGYWAMAAFHKDLVSYTYTQGTLSDFTGFPTGVPGVTPRIFQGMRWIPQNGEGGYIQGLEFTLSLPGEKLTPVLTGFGFVGSASFFRSSIQPDLGNPAMPMPGLSDRVLNGTVYYEKGGFGARVSARYRSDFRGDIASFGPRGAIFRNLQAETVIDAQTSYAFKKGRLKGLTLIAQAYNLTDEPLFATQGEDIRMVQDYQRYGTSYSVGASYKF